MTPPLKLRAIQAAVAEAWGVELADLLSARRSRRVSEPRQVAMYLCKRLTGKSLPEIGVSFERDHTTVMHALRVVYERMEADQDYRFKVIKLEGQLSDQVPEDTPIETFIEQTLSELRVVLLAKARRDPVALLKRMMSV